MPTPQTAPTRGQSPTSSKSATVQLKSESATVHWYDEHSVGCRRYFPVQVSIAGFLLLRINWTLLELSIAKQYLFLEVWLWTGLRHCMKLNRRACGVVEGTVCGGGGLLGRRLRKKDRKCESRTTVKRINSMGCRAVS